MTTETDMPPALPAPDERFLPTWRSRTITRRAASAPPCSRRSAGPACRRVFGSGTADERMEAAGISASRIAAAARRLVKD
jgi:hypothetical protein